MKTTSLAALFLLFAFSSHSLLGTSQVLDSDGEPINSGDEYLVVSVLRGAGSGGAAFGATRNKTCPNDVVLLPDFFPPSPVKFSWRTRQAFMLESSDIQIQFSRAPSCSESGVWKVDNFDTSTGQWFITTGGGGVDGSGFQDVLSSFKVEKINDAYKFVYCPSVCPSCVTLCSDVGQYDDNGNRRLALTGEWPYTFHFVKANRARIAMPAI